MGVSALNITLKNYEGGVKLKVKAEFAPVIAKLQSKEKKWKNLLHRYHIQSAISSIRFNSSALNVVFPKALILSKI